MVLFADRFELARLLREHVNSRFATQRAAAKALGIHPSKYNRLLKGRLGAVTVESWGRMASEIWRLSPSKGRASGGLYEAIRRTILGSAERMLMERCDEWALETGELYAAMLSAPLADVVRSLDGAESVMAFLRQHPPYRKALEAFSDRVRARHGHSRAHLALNRVLAPLLAAAWTKGVELSAAELHSSRTLYKYLRCALQAEEVLLDRPPDLQRIYDLTGRAAPPSSGMSQKRPS